MRRISHEGNAQLPLEQETKGTPGDIRKRQRHRLMMRSLGVLLLLITTGGVFFFFYYSNACACQGNPYPGARATAQTFYQLLQQRNYMAASKQFNDDALVAGQGMTPQSFVSQAREIDSRQGPIQTFQIRDVQLQRYDEPSTMAITIAVTRGKQMYLAHLNLVGNGRGWKITTLDTL